MTAKIDYSRLAQFGYAVITIVGPDGYPYSVPTEFELGADKRIFLKRPGEQIPPGSVRAGVLFNHITAMPTGGYGERRYMLIWGKLVNLDGKLELQPEALTEWDEKILPFPELCARAAPQGQKYLQTLSRQIEA